MSTLNLREIYTRILLPPQVVRLEGSDAFDHIIAQCIAPVHARVQAYLHEHSLLQASEEEASAIVQGLLSGQLGCVLPSIQPYRRLSSTTATLQTSSPAVADPSFLGFEATARGLLHDGKIIEAGKLFSTNKRDHDKLDLAVMRGAVRLGKTMNRLRKNPLTVSSNATSALLNRTDFAGSILEVLNDEEFDPKQFILEILEDNDLSADQIRKCEGLKALSDSGLRISMDDLGRKNSLANLGILTAAKVPIYEVKFDGADTHQMTDPARWANMDHLLLKAGESGATQLVWEGFWKGFGAEVTQAVVEYHAHSQVASQWKEPIFEGTIL